MRPLASREATLQQQLQTVREIYARHGLNHSGIDALAPLIDNFEIRIP